MPIKIEIVIIQLPDGTLQNECHVLVDQKRPATPNENAQAIRLINHLGIFKDRCVGITDATPHPDQN